MRGVWGKCSPELAEHDGLVGEGGGASTAANRRRRARGSGESSVKLASSTSSIGPSSSPDRRRRRRCACWTRSRGLSPALAASSRVDERRWRSGELGKACAVRERRQREGEWTRGVLGRLWARLEGSGPSTASRRWRGGRRRAQAARWHSTEQLGCAGWKTTGGGGCWAGWAFALGDR